MALPRGLRNNNPGNIRLSSTKWIGEIQPSKDPAFKQFKSMEYGYRAVLKLLKNYSIYHECRTIEQIIARWAPSSENNTKAYVASVEKVSGINRNAIIDVDSEDQMCALTAAISQHENGVKADMAVIRKAWEVL
jgi:hypothetical protein